MADPAKKPAAWQKIARLALIPILVVVLLIICLMPDSETLPESVDPQTTVDVNADDQSVDAVASTDSSRSESNERPRRPVSPIALNSILEHDPFALSAAVSQELNSTVTRSEDELEEEVDERMEDIVDSLKSEKLNVVFRGEKGVSAILGDRVLHEGDEIEPGVRIRKITAGGLTLEIDDDFEPEDADD